VSESEITCVHIIPERPHIVIAGTTAGTLQLWDTREPNNQHYLKSYKVDELPLDLVIRFPTYTTDWLVTENHHAPVVCFMNLVYLFTSNLI